MSEDDAVPDEERLSAARSRVVESLAEYADGWSTTEGGVVTAFVALFEVVGADAVPRLVEIHGDGSDRGLTPWRRSGILFEALHEGTTNR